MKTCCKCGLKFEKTPYEFPLNVVFDTDEFEVRWDLKDIIRKSDREMILNIKSYDNDDIILCIDCYNKIIEDIIYRIKSDKKISK